MYSRIIKQPKYLQRKRTQLLSTAIGVALACGGGNVALAQDDAVEEIVITGSRIVRRDFDSQSPIVTIEAATFEERSNIGLEAALNQLPQFQPAGTQSTGSSAGTPFPTATAAPGAATVNLRGLGTNRSLVLVDGRRVQPVNGSLVVDLNTIPSSAIESIEVITGGAAAVYGADAISGVVNLKLKKNFQGAEFDAQYGITQEGDGEELQLSGLIGADFADGRGNVMLGVSYAKREDIFGKDRAYVRRGWNDPGTAAGGIGNSNLSQYNYGGGNAPTIGFVPLGATYGIDQNGNVFDPSDPLNAAHPYTGPLGGDSGFKVSPDGTLGFDDHVNTYLQLPLDRYSFFGSANFDLSDNTTFFTDVRFSETKTVSEGFVSNLFNIWSPTVPYNPAFDDPSSPTFGQADLTLGETNHPVSQQMADLLNSRATPDAPWTYEGGLDYFPNYSTVTTSNVFQFITGLRGDVVGTDDWTWEVYGSHGKSTVNAQQPDGFPYLPRIQNLFNANQYGTGYAVSYPIAITGGCTSGLPIFNPDGSINDTPSTTKDCADYTVLRMNSITTLTQNVFEANMQGSLFELPGGTLQFAAGVSYREENFRFDPDTGYNANQDFPNVVQNIALPVSVDGSTNVAEFYLELAIPIVSDLPFIQSLEIDPAIRISDYNTAGRVETYKIMGDWVVNDKVMFRGGFQRANRAANVAELFTPVGGSSLDFSSNDSCANYGAAQSPTWGNVATNPNRLNVQLLCQELITRDGAPASLYTAGTPSADNYAFNVFGGTNPFGISLGVTGGNPDLESEEADTVTAGVVISSPFETPALESLRLSIDYYKIEITGAIGLPQHLTVYQQCLDAQFNTFIGDAPGSHTGAELAANNPFCDLIQREYIAGTNNVYGADRKFKATYINQGGITSEGVDVQVDWGAALEDLGMGSLPGMFSMNFQVSFLDKYEVSPFPGGAFVDYTGTTTNASFDYQTFTTFNYSNGAYSLGLRWQYLPELDVPPGSAPGNFGVDSHNQFDLFGRWGISDRYELRAGIDNLFDAQPEVVGASTVNNNLGSTGLNYDTIGRRFFLAVKASF